LLYPHAAKLFILLLVDVASAACQSLMLF
jgi:hypothetical protein